MMPYRLGDGAADSEVAAELGGRFVRGLEGRARQFKLAARLERDRPAALCVKEADQVSAVLDSLPPKLGVHALDERGDTLRACIRHGRELGAVEGNLLVLRADAERPGR